MKYLTYVLLHLAIVLPTIFLTTCDVKAEECCGTISGIWEGKDQKKESRFLQIYRNNEPINAKVGTELLEKDRIQANEANVNFEITWYSENKQAKHAIFNAPAHITLEECNGETRFNLKGDVLGIIESIKSKRRFKIKAEPASATIRGTNFTITFLEDGKLMKFVLIRGEAYIENAHGSITLNSHEVGYARRDSSPWKDKINKEQIAEELRWVFEIQSLPDIYRRELGQYWQILQERPTQQSQTQMDPHKLLPELTRIPGLQGQIDKTEQKTQVSIEGKEHTQEYQVSPPSYQGNVPQGVPPAGVQQNQTPPQSYQWE